VEIRNLVIPEDKNITQTEAEKKLNYKNSCIRGTTDTVHVLHDDTTNGDTAIETKGLKKNMKAISGKHSIELLQQTATLGT
jgi:hypothetical protein